MRILTFLFLMVAGSIFGQLPFSTLQNDTAICFFASSYDTEPYHYFGDYVASWLALNHPEQVNHWVNCSRSGGSVGELNEGDGNVGPRLEKFGLPIWASASHAIGIAVADDNGGYTSNTLYFNITNTIRAPTAFWNGFTNTDPNGTYTNEHGWAASHSITWILVGAIPGDVSGGSSDPVGGELGRNNAMTNAAARNGLQGVEMWHSLWDNGWSADQATGGTLGGWYANSHPASARSLTMAINIALALAGSDTNISMATVDWNGSVVSTNHCYVTALGQVGQTLTFHRADARLPMAWDFPDGTITNDCRNAFLLMPQYANAFNYTLTVQNLPAGDYEVAVDGTPVATMSDSVLSAGWNMFTNTAGPIWAQRKEVLGRIRDKHGVDRVTLLQDHDAGTTPSGGVDEINYQSNAQAQWALGKRGDTLISALSTWTTSLANYDNLIAGAAQSVNRTFTVTHLNGRILSTSARPITYSGSILKSP